MIYILSFLMVSTVRYMSFKQLDVGSRKPFHVLVALILIFIVIAYKPMIMLFFMMLFYILSGPVTLLYRLQGRRKREERPASSVMTLSDKNETRPAGD